MQPYKFSRLRTIFITNFGAKEMNRIATISAICCLIGIVVYFSTPNHFVWLAVIPFGFPFMPFVLFRLGIAIFENYRIKKYCKQVDARLKAMVYGVFNTAVASQFLTFNINKLTVNSGNANQNSYTDGLGFGVSRPSDGAEIIYFRKTTDLGAIGTANLHGFDGIQFRTQGSETVKMTILSAGDVNTINGRYKYNAVSATTDTVGDWRTYSDVSGFYTQVCTVANATKGSGTWVTKNTIAST